MKKNMGTTDQGIRLFVATILVALYFSGTITGTLGIVALAAAVLFILTSLVGYCPLYSLLGFNTCAHSAK